MKKISMMIFFTLPLFAIGQTYIADKQAVSGVWKVDASPYIVEGEAIVETGKTLTIQPGVVIQFKVGTNRDYREDGVLNPEFNVGFLRVEGTVIAKGLPTKMITFTSYGSGNWGNVGIFNSNNSVFENCKFSNSYYVRSVTPEDNATGALSFNNSKGTVKNCLFALNGWTAINCKHGSEPQLSNLTIVDNKYGIECNSDSKPIISNVILWNNEEPFYLNGDSKPSISNSSIQVETFPDGAIDKGKNLLGVNPMFVNSENKDYHLQKISPLFGKKIGFIY